MPLKVLRRTRDIAASLGTIGPETLQTMLNEGRSVRDIAIAAGHSAEYVATLLARPNPKRDIPLNFSRGATAGTVNPYPGPYAGLTGIAHTTDWGDVGVTWGAPVYQEQDQY